MEILKEYSDIHLIIATHSHILVSELPNDNISIVTIVNNGSSVIGELFDNSVFGWNIDSILYNVFNTKSVRNYSIEKDVEFLLKNISNVEEKEESIRLLNKLERIEFDINDPLLILIKKIKESHE